MGQVGHFPMDRDKEDNKEYSRMFVMISFLQEITDGREDKCGREQTNPDFTTNGRTSHPFDLSPRRCRFSEATANYLQTQDDICGIAGRIGHKR